MKRLILVAVATLFVPLTSVAQTTPDDSTFRLALPDHRGQLRWRADGFKIVEASATDNGHEIGLRGAGPSGRLMFLAFLFVPPAQTPLDSVKCREEAVASDEKDSPSFHVVGTTETTLQEGISLALVTYTNKRDDGKTIYSLRGFLAKGDICGDLEIYSITELSLDDPELKKIFASYRLDPGYEPQFLDYLFYAQTLFKNQRYAAAAPLFERALSDVPDDSSQVTMRRVVTDQAGMAYGISGNLTKSRAIFNAAIGRDPDYPMYYYNLACADAQENKLADARLHLQQAFARKANMIQGETIPDPSQDDSFTAYRNDKDFWTFIQSLR
jgi:tetratricopeptide (TPR) repeat protein